MDYLKLIDSFRGVACVISRRKAKEGGGDEYTIAAANRNYLASVNKLSEEFVPGRSYTYYVAQDSNFEALVDSCILGGKIAHHYVNADLYNAWLDLYMLPLCEDGDGNGCCLFTYEMNFESESDKMIDISATTAYLVLKTCIKFRENLSFKETMDSIVKDIRNQCESDGCAIILTDNANRRIDICCFDSASDNAFAPQDDDIFFKPEFYDIVTGWRDIMGGSNCFIISGEKELKEVEKKDVNWYRSLVYTGVKSLVLYPLRVHENLYGYIFATNFNSDKTSFIREVMELNSFILSAEVENYRMRQELEKLSTTDMLTGLLNRNAMSKKVRELELDAGNKEHGLGVVFVDLNGLKVANDLKGHNEGDAMLKNVANKLKSVYGDRGIYRAGGDEFLVITDDMDRDEFYLYYDKLESLSRVPGEPTFALGADYDDKEKNIGKIMHNADKNMYRNKAEYYEANPELDRRDC
ncbi:MAG: GGDEF domain-containing protein [Lachnospiraceae bacterium]|nr:GGDEF domain-containing protein [Lachnospiraceae bacterium]MBR5765408.1 GGDEF domain-containing protein [Lachnospiraceae bacterium]